MDSTRQVHGSETLTDKDGVKHEISYECVEGGGTTVMVVQDSCDGEISPTITDEYLVVTVESGNLNGARETLRKKVLQQLGLELEAEPKDIESMNSFAELQSFIRNLDSIDDVTALSLMTVIKRLKKEGGIEKLQALRLMTAIDDKMED